MSVTLSRRLVCEVRWPKLCAKAPALAPTLMTAPTLSEMDAQLERHIEVVQAAFLKQARTFAERAAGKLRKEYKAAREALTVGEGGGT
jgi:hypothetical protein